MPDPGPRAGIPADLPCLAAQDHPDLLPACVFGSGCNHVFLCAFTPRAPALESAGKSAVFYSGNHFLSFEATAIPASWGLSTGTAQQHGHPAAEHQFTSSELVVIMKDGGRLSGLCGEGQGIPGISGLWQAARVEVFAGAVVRRQAAAMLDPHC